MRRSSSQEPDSSEPARLREAERGLAHMRGETVPDIRERVAKLEERRGQFATKAELESEDVGTSMRDKRYTFISFTCRSILRQFAA